MATRDACGGDCERVRERGGAHVSHDGGEGAVAGRSVGKGNFHHAREGYMV